MVDKTEQQAVDEAHLAAAEAYKNAEYIDIAETNRKLNALKKEALLKKKKLGGE